MHPNPDPDPNLTLTDGTSVWRSRASVPVSAGRLQSIGRDLSHEPDAPVLLRRVDLRQDIRVMPVASCRSH